MHVLSGTEVLQSHSFERLSIHLYVYQLKTLHSVLAEKDEISVHHATA